jgi:hypothetical protein
VGRKSLKLAGNLEDLSNSLNASVREIFLSVYRSQIPLWFNLKAVINNHEFGFPVGIDPSVSVPRIKDKLSKWAVVPQENVITHAEHWRSEIRICGLTSIWPKGQIDLKQSWIFLKL